MVIYLLECIIPKIARNFKRCLRYNQKNYANAYNLGEKHLFIIVQQVSN